MVIQSVPTRESIGARIRLAREQSGIRQEDVAARLGIPRPSVSELEAGRRDVSSLELVALGQLFSKPVQWFVAGDERFEPDAWDPANFHLRGGELTAEDRTALLRFASRCYEYAALERLLGLQRQVPRPRYEGLRGLHINQGKQAAQLERRRLELGSGPVGNVVALLEQEGIKVLDWRMPADSEIDGALFTAEETGPCVLLNDSNRWSRRQFSAAHEYAHLLLDVDGGRSEICYAGSQELAEKRANAFAAEFLSPAEGVKGFLARLGVPSKRTLALGDVIELQRYFGVSYQTTLWRLLNLGLLEEDQRQQLAAYKPISVARRLGYEQSEDQDRSSSGRFVELALKAWRENRITRGKLAELLEVTKADADRLTRSLANATV
jgi:Zn-dependent peptidase ImmA (M78 family)/transcriptional regulator with XRE-family HTH domain